MNEETIGFGGMLLTIFCVFFLFLSLTTCVTGSLWVSKVATEDLQDTYNIVLYSVGYDTARVKSYILSSPQNILTSTQIDLAFGNTPAIIFKNVSGANANKIITDLRALGSIVDAV